MKKSFFFLIMLLYILPTTNIFASEKSASIVINADTGEIIFGENYNTKMAIASTTKIMTAIVAMENSSATDIFAVSKNAESQEGSSVYLAAGQKITQKELLYALMLNSGNDAAMAIAENICDTQENFAKLMNEKVTELNLKNTHFENPSGLPSPEHYSTAYDMSIIMAYAMKNDYFAEIVSKKEHQIESRSGITYLKNHNKLLWQYPYCVGGKTGFTKEAGRCLVTCSKKDGKTIVCVTLDYPDDWQYHINSSEKAFEKIEKVKILDQYDILTTKKINQIPVNLIAKDDVFICMSEKNKRNLVCKISLDDTANRDISIGEKVGTANIFYKKNNIATVELLSGSNVKKHPYNAFLGNFSYVLRRVLLSKRT